MKKVLIPIGLILLLLAGYISVSATKGTGEPQREVITKRYVAAEGKVEAMPGLDVRVGSELTARVESFFAREGEWVKKGDVIARLDNKDVQAKLKETEGELVVARAKLKEVASGSRPDEIKKATASVEAAAAELDLSSKNLDRYKELYNGDVIPLAQLEEKERAYKVAKAMFDEAEEEKILLEKGPKAETLKLHEDTIARAEAAVEYYVRLLEKSIIKAPISGKVIHRYLEEGEIVTPDIPLLAIADIDKIRVNAEVDETDIGRIQITDPVEVTSDAYPGKAFKGEIQEISDYVGVRKVVPNNPAKNTDMKVVQVKIGLKEKTPLKIGMTVDVKIVPRENQNQQ